MKSMHVLAAVAIMGVGATCAVAKDNQSVDPTLELARSQAGEVEQWTKVAQGMYEGVAADGTFVSVYAGTEGATLMRSMIGRELNTVRSQLDAASVGKRSDAARVDALINEVAFLQTEHDRLTALIDYNARPAAKASQTFDLNTGLFCGYNTSTRAIFSNDGMLLSMGRFFPFGNVTAGTPWPNYVYRRVFTRTESGGVPVSHGASSAVRTQALVSQSMKDEVAAECALRVGHSMEVQCTAGAPYGYFAITREQTCTGLNAGNPPVVYPTP